MTLQPIIYRDQTVAAATRAWFVLADELDERPAGDPERTFVIFMCAYAGCVLLGVLPGPYTDEDARRFARCCLIPAELLERATLDVEHVARALQVPADELRAARSEHRTIASDSALLASSACDMPADRGRGVPSSGRDSGARWRASELGHAD